MPHKCSVPNCKGNYLNGPKVSVFSFPADEEQRLKWIRAIHRKDFIPTKHSRVCELHFKDDEIERSTSMFDEKNGRLLTAPLLNPRLVKDAVPSQFPNCPQYLSGTTTASREDPENRRRRVENQCLENAIADSLRTCCEHAEAITFKDFEELKLKVNDITFNTEWDLLKKESGLYFILIKEEPNPRISCCVKVTQDLQVSLFVNNVEVKRCKEMSLPKHVQNLTEIERLLHSAHSLYASSTMSSSQDIGETLSVLDGLLQQLENKFPEKKHMLNFLKEQLFLLPKKRVKNYSWELMVFSSLVHSISPHCYKFIRGSGNLTLPAPRTLQIICSKLITNPLQEKNDNYLLYVKSKFPLLSPEDKLVLLSMDEVHIKPQLDFKQGRVVGTAMNSDECATSAYVFMVHSVLSHYKDVAHIVPVTSIHGEELFNSMKTIILGLEDVGFEVVAVIADNSALNRKAVSLLSDPPELKHVYSHPKDKNRKLFFIIDTVHILKCVRNNWLNVKDQQLYFPDITECEKMHVACFSLLKHLHSLEKKNLLKYGFSLTLKALYPTSLERQNVSLALKIFNHPLAIALKEIGPKKNLDCWESTANFIEIICTWWDIVNVKTLWKGKRLRNPFQEPITKVSCHIEYLEKFVQWLDNWKSSNSYGRLSKETHSALTLSTMGLSEMANYFLVEKGHSFFLPGKVQTDNLEARFGKYRQLAGSQYNISLRQIYEVENKLRLQSVMELNSAVTNGAENEECDIGVFVECTADENDVDGIEEEYWPLLHYISGYCSYVIMKRYSCNYCEVFICNETGNGEAAHSNLINANNRGGLCHPHNDVVLCTSYCFIIMNKLIQNDFKTQFLHHSSQLNVLLHVSMKCLPPDIFMGHKCPTHTTDLIQRNILHTASNILINNFVKDFNDDAKSKTLVQHKRRKLLQCLVMIRKLVQ